jgi:hypothetical protein
MDLRQLEAFKSREHDFHHVTFLLEKVIDPYIKNDNMTYSGIEIDPGCFSEIEGKIRLILTLYHIPRLSESEHKKSIIVNQ